MGDQTRRGAHFSCSLTAVMLARLHAFGGEEAVGRLLQESGIDRSPEYLLELGNWISYDEAVALWRAGAAVTRDLHFARHLGEEASQRLNASPVAALLRSLGSPEEVYRQIVTTASKFSVVTEQECLQARPGFAEVRFRSREGFPRSPEHCEWTAGLLTQTPVLFGLPPAIVEHDCCAALGAPDCRYRMIWDVGGSAGAKSGSTANTGHLQSQLDAMTERLQSMFATAADLIAAGDLGVTLAQITDRAALEVRAPAYLLAVDIDGERHTHQRGIEEDAVPEIAQRILADEEVPPSWLVVPVRSHRNDYGRLLAMYGDGQSFFDQEHELLEVYARYAATALDTASALAEARRRHEQASALLELARALASAGTSDEVASRLAEAVRTVVDCDRVGVYLWNDAEGALERRAACIADGGADPEPADWRAGPEDYPVLGSWLAGERLEPVCATIDGDDPLARRFCARIGALASIAVPIRSREHLFGSLVVSVSTGQERLHPSADLLDRLSGIAAHATTALENGRLVDRITHQARHDTLTGLANRAELNERLARVGRAADARFALFYIDLDGFKPINDEHGHQVGDALLVAVAERLHDCARDGDTIARLGGDEFAVLVPSIEDESEVELILRRIATAFEEDFQLQQGAVRVGASVGCALWPRDAHDLEGLVRHADGMMYSRKRLRHARAS